MVPLPPSPIEYLAFCYFVPLVWWETRTLVTRLLYCTVCPRTAPQLTPGRHREKLVDEKL